MSKYVMVTSGVCSSLGKGVTAASLGALFISHGYKVSLVKCDPYINVDAGNITEAQRGEVFVTQDGAETDGDLGNFERFTGVQITGDNCITMGKVYLQVITNERSGRYNGRTVQVIPHITDEIKRRILRVGTQSGADIVIIEVGGTVGDIETIPYLEAGRQLIGELQRGAMCVLHIALVPAITGGELKTKPTQHSVKQLQEAGIQPDVLLCRTRRQLDEAVKRKIALFCNVSSDAVFTSTDVEHTIYELPLIFRSEGLDAYLLGKLGFANNTAPDVSAWTTFCDRVAHPKSTVRIAMVGQKDTLDEGHKSVAQSLFHAAVTDYSVAVEVVKVDAEDLEGQAADAEKVFDAVDGVVVSGNHGQRGFLGLLMAVRYARENGVPYLGIDLGMQLMAVETARTLCGWADADSTEYQGQAAAHGQGGHAVISLPDEQTGLTATGLMKLGAAVVHIHSGTRLAAIYGKTEVTERHRNCRIFDRRYEADMASHGLIVSAEAEGERSAEAFEWTGHPWGIGVQYHIETVSRPDKPHPLFSSFIGAALQRRAHGGWFPSEG